MTKRDFATADLVPPVPYQLLTSTIVPRPIAWVSTRSASGVDNLAPHSFFTVASVNPPVVAFTSVGAKDTLRNVQETGEFVVCLASEALTEQVNETSRPLPPEASEFDRAGVTREPSVHVAPARVAESPVALECRLTRVVAVGNCFMILGEVVGFAIDETALDPGAPHAVFDALRPMAKLGRDEWAAPGEVSSRPRPQA
ncbi:MAG TPA: flavin reductase family protein [Propionibacteriaceae bacterium]|nr:flavin reductase family protein [Propionibacteriaceae bacterium]